MAPSPYIFILSIGPVDMNQYARFDEIPSITLKDIRYKGNKALRTNGRTKGQRENSIPTHKHSLRRGGGGGGYKKKWWEPQYLANPPNLILSGVTHYEFSKILSNLSNFVSPNILNGIISTH